MYYEIDVAKIAISSVGQISEAIAPPIDPGSTKFPGKIEIWLCMSGMAQEMIEKMQKVCRHTSKEMWLASRNRYQQSMALCQDVNVNLVDDPQPQYCYTLSDAVKLAEVWNSDLGNDGTTSKTSRPEPNDFKTSTVRDSTLLYSSRVHDHRQ
jgi:hypothetical protein